MSLKVRPAIRFKAIIYWKLLIFLLRHSSVSFDFLKTTRGFKVLEMRSNGTYSNVKTMIVGWQTAVILAK